MKCEELVEKMHEEEYEQMLSFLRRDIVSVEKMELNRAKRLNFQANQIYRAKLLKSLKKQVHPDSEAELYRHPNRNKNYVIRNISC